MTMSMKGQDKILMFKKRISSKLHEETYASKQLAWTWVKCTTGENLSHTFIKYDGVSSLEGRRAHQFEWL